MPSAVRGRGGRHSTEAHTGRMRTSSGGPAGNFSFWRGQLIPEQGGRLGGGVPPGRFRVPGAARQSHEEARRPTHAAGECPGSRADVTRLLQPRERRSRGGHDGARLQLSHHRAALTTAGARREPRLGEQLGRILGVLAPPRWRPVSATRVAQALVLAAKRDAPGGHILENRALRWHSARQGASRAPIQLYRQMAEHLDRGHEADVCSRGRVPPPDRGSSHVHPDHL